MVSPSERPRPSIVPPITPPRPYGSTTVLIMPHLVAPSAYAPSRSPGGACENASRITEQAIGVTMSDTTVPAMNADEVYTVAEASGLRGSAPVTLKSGIHEKYVEIHRDSPTTWPWR